MLVERHQRHVYQLCYRFVGNHEDASDLAQDVFIRAYRGLQEVQGRGVARHLAVSHRRERLPEQGRREDAEAGRARSAAGGERRAHRVARRRARPTRVLRGERAGQVRAAIAQLPKKQRATLILRVYHELPHEEIAGILGSSVGAVKANFFHALNNLKKLMLSGMTMTHSLRIRIRRPGRGRARPRRAAHVETCAPCREQADALRAMLRDDARRSTCPSRRRSSGITCRRACATGSRRSRRRAIRAGRGWASAASCRWRPRSRWSSPSSRGVLLVRAARDGPRAGRRSIASGAGRRRRPSRRRERDGAGSPTTPRSGRC